MPIYSVFAQDEPLAIGVAETLWQLRTQSNRQASIRELSVSFSGSNATDTPVKCEILRYSSSGTAATFTPRRWDMNDPLATTQAATAFSAEPTAGEILFPFRLTPNNGVLVMQYAQDARFSIPINSWFGFRCTAAAVVNVTTHVAFEE
jgi:hypothetical protein